MRLRDQGGRKVQRSISLEDMSLKGFVVGFMFGILLDSAIHSENELTLLRKVVLFFVGG